MFQHFMFSLLTGSADEYRRAFLQTFLVALIFVGVCGAVFLPGEVEESFTALDVAVKDCQISSDDDSLIMLVRYAQRHSRGENGARFRFLEHKLGESRPLEATVPADLKPTCFAASREHPLLYVSDESDGSIQAVTLNSAPFVRRIGRHVHGCAHTLALSPDESTLISLSEHEIYAWDTRRAQLNWCRLHERPVSVVVLPDSQTMVYCSSESKGCRIEEVDLRSGETLQILHRTYSAVRELAVSDDGRYLAGMDRRAGALLFERTGSEGRWVDRRICGDASDWQSARPAFSPDSKWLAFDMADGRGVLVWDLKHGRIQGRLPVAEESTLRGTMFLDSDTLLAWHKDGTIREWKMPGESQLDLGPSIASR